jgi:hypothetical protein
VVDTGAVVEAAGVEELPPPQPVRTSITAMISTRGINKNLRMGNLFLLLSVLQSGISQVIRPAY